MSKTDGVEVNVEMSKKPASMAELLESCGLQHRTAAFESEGYTIEISIDALKAGTLLEDLKELNLPLGERRMFVDQVEQLQKTPSAPRLSKAASVGPVETERSAVQVERSVVPGESQDAKFHAPWSNMHLPTAHRPPWLHMHLPTAPKDITSASNSLLATHMPLFIIALMIGLIQIYVDAVMPCFRCRDFRASVVHEIGHLLSLDHATGADGTIPLIIDPPFQPPAPPPPPPAVPSEDPLAPYNPVVKDKGNWTAFRFSCEAPEMGVLVDPAATFLLSPPPPPLPPPESPPPPLIPNATYPPPPATPPLLPPNATVEARINWTLATYPPKPVVAATNVTKATFDGKMGSLLDLNSTVMLAFGSTAFERPGAGSPRRCLNQDDLNGINFLYPMCGLQLLQPPCIDDILQTTNVSARLSESYIKLMALPLLIIAGVKLLAYALLFLEDVVANWRVKREAKRLLDAAEEAERRRKAEAEGLDPDAESPSRSPFRRLGFKGFGKGKGKIDPKAVGAGAIVAAAPTATRVDPPEPSQPIQRSKKGFISRALGKKTKSVAVIDPSPAAPAPEATEPGTELAVSAPPESIADRADRLVAADGN